MNRYGSYIFSKNVDEAICDMLIHASIDCPIVKIAPKNIYEADTLDKYDHVDCLYKYKTKETITAFGIDIKTKENPYYTNVSLSFEFVKHAHNLYYHDYKTDVLKNILVDNNVNKYVHLVLFLYDFEIDFSKKIKVPVIESSEFIENENNDCFFQYMETKESKNGKKFYIVPIKKLKDYSYITLFYGWKGNKKYENPYFEYLDLNDLSKIKQYDFCINDVLCIYSFLRKNICPIINSNKFDENKIKEIIINKVIEACERFKINKNACNSLLNKMSLK